MRNGQIIVRQSIVIGTDNVDNLVISIKSVKLPVGDQTIVRNIGIKFLLMTISNL